MPSWSHLGVKIGSTPSGTTWIPSLRDPQQPDDLALRGVRVGDHRRRLPGREAGQAEIGVRERAATICRLRERDQIMDGDDRSALRKERQRVIRGVEHIEAHAPADDLHAQLLPVHALDDLVGLCRHMPDATALTDPERVPRGATRCCSHRSPPAAQLPGSPTPH